jgi:hypothetical protein
LSLVLINGTDSDITEARGCHGVTHKCNVSIVGRNHEHIGGREFTVWPDQRPYKRDNSLCFFIATALVIRVLDGKKIHSRSGQCGERSSARNLASVEPSTVELLGRELGELRVEPVGNVEE